MEDCNILESIFGPPCFGKVPLLDIQNCYRTACYMAVALLNPSPPGAQKAPFGSQSLGRKVKFWAQKQPGNKTMKKYCTGTTRQFAI